VIRRTAHPPTDTAISLVEESGRVQRVANFPVARDSGAIAKVARHTTFSVSFKESANRASKSLAC